nr:hypothetical protein B0A51_17737 [Rachicladosporium sp. CCFEE 5018]
MDSNEPQQKLTLARHVLRHAETSLSSSSNQPQRQIEGPRPKSPNVASAAKSPSKKRTRQIEGTKPQLQIAAPAAKPSSSRVESERSSTRTTKTSSNALPDPPPGAMAQTISLVERFLGPKPITQDERERALVKQPKKTRVGHGGQPRGRSPVQQRSPSPSYSSASTLSDSGSSYSRSMSPYRRRPSLEDSTAIHGHDTFQWGGAVRQKAVRKGRRRLQDYDDDVSDELAHAALGVCPHNWRWYPVKLGYLCGGGHHLISHRHAEEVMAGRYPDGAPVEKVNGAPNVIDRAITPPPGDGDGFYNLDKEGCSKANKTPLPKNHRGQWWDGDRYCDHRHETWRHKR